MLYVIIVSCYMKKLNFLHLKEDKKESNIERNEILMSMVKSQLSSITAVRERGREREVQVMSMMNAHGLTLCHI